MPPHATRRPRAHPEAQVDAYLSDSGFLDVKRRQSGGIRREDLDPKEVNVYPIAGDGERHWQVWPPSVKPLKSGFTPALKNIMIFTCNVPPWGPGFGSPSGSQLMNSITSQVPWKMGPPRSASSNALNTVKAPPPDAVPWSGSNVPAPVMWIVSWNGSS